VWTTEVEVKVWGEYACFTRPESKVERVSYPVITPGAARGVLEAIYWKPEFQYRIKEVGILKIGGQMTLLRNEISRRQGEDGAPFSIEDDGVRQQRMSLILTDVAYRIKALICVKPYSKDPPPKYRDCFYRRVDRGQYHHTPYFGTREFAASFDRPHADDVPDQALNMTIGAMLFDTAYVPETGKEAETRFYRHDASACKETTGRATRVMFQATIKNGVLIVPQVKYDEIVKMEAGNATGTH
jgi:CRISPR-associated protein Cas5d